MEKEIPLKLAQSYPSYDFVSLIGLFSHRLAK
jgi:hypothetical protein